MKLQNITLEVIINGRVAREYQSPQNQMTYIEGRNGSEFTLRVRNGTPQRVLVIPSVDGLSVMDGEPAGEKSSGYILDGYSTIDIKGWRVDDDTVAKFVFSGKGEKGDESYVAQIDGDTANKGAIGILVIAEKKIQPLINSVMRGFPPSSPYPSSPYPSSPYPSIGGGITWSSNCDTVGMMASSASAVPSASMGCAVDEPINNLGTKFGEALDNKVDRKIFNRGDIIATIALGYDDSRGLRRLGIDVRERSVLEKAFPEMATGCKPPADWKR